MHTLLGDLRGNIPSFIHISDWQAAKSTFMPSICSCRKPEPSTSCRSWLRRLCPAFMCCTKPGPSSSRVPSRTSMLIQRLFGANRPSSDRSTGIICDQTISLSRLRWHRPVRITPKASAEFSAVKDREVRQDAGRSSRTNNFSLPAGHHLRAAESNPVSRWQVELFGESSPGGIKQHLRIKQFYGTSENAVEDADLQIAVSVYAPRRHRQEAPRQRMDASLYTLLQILSVTLGEKMPKVFTSSTCGRRKSDAGGALQTANQLKGLFVSA